MKYENIILATTDLEATHLFYVRLLGLPVLAHSATHLSLLLGYTRLTLQKMDQASTPRHVTIQLLRDSLAVLMKNYDEGAHRLAQMSSKMNNRLLKPPHNHLHFYDPSGHLIELIPQVHRAIEATDHDPCRVEPMEQLPVLVYI